jgi:hypothetical protein
MTALIEFRVSGRLHGSNPGTLERFVSRARNVSAVSDAPHGECVGSLGNWGARPIQPFEGSRRWGGIMQIQWCWVYERGLWNSCWYWKE